MEMTPIEANFVAKEMWKQIIATTSINVVMSWGVSRKISIVHEGMATMCLIVNGFIHKGLCMVQYNEGADTYIVSTLDADKNVVDRRTDVYFEELGNVIDVMVERGTCSQKEYEQKCNEAIYG